MYTVLPSPLLQRISGLRFQPLVDLHSGQVFAHEVLVEIHNVNLEVLFASLPSRSALQIFFAGQHPVTDTRPGRLLAKPSGRTPSRRTRYPVVAGVTPSAAVND